MLFSQYQELLTVRSQRQSFDVPCLDALSPRLALMDFPDSLFKVMFPWWQSALVKLFNLVLAWSAVPSLWKHSIIVPIFKQGDPSSPGNFRPVSLRLAASKFWST